MEGGCDTVMCTEDEFDLRPHILLYISGTYDINALELHDTFTHTTHSWDLSPMPVAGHPVGAAIEGR